MTWLAILVVLAGQGGRPAPEPPAVRRLVALEATPSRDAASPRSFVLEIRAGHRPFRPALGSIEGDAREVEEDDEARVSYLDLLGLDLAAWLAWARPLSTGDPGRFHRPDPSPLAPLHLRC